MAVPPWRGRSQGATGQGAAERVHRDAQQVAADEATGAWGHFSWRSINNVLLVKIGLGRFGIPSIINDLLLKGQNKPFY